MAILHIKKGESVAFENSFSNASNIIASMPGYIAHEMLQCIEENDKYILMVRWQQLEDHTEGFRKSRQYQEWKNLLHHYYDPFPVVEHYK